VTDLDRAAGGRRAAEIRTRAAGEAAAGTLAARWRRAVRAGADPARVARGVAAVRGVGEARAEPGRIAAQVDAGDGAPQVVALVLDVVGPAWRERFLRALDLGPDAPPPPPHDPRVAALVAGGGPDPVPPPLAVRPRCACGDAAPAGWCAHACALAERVAEGLEGRGPDLLWRARGLVAAVAAGGPGGGQGEGPSLAEAAAFWGDGEAGALPPLVPWREAPAAVVRLGPLPAARGQMRAVEPVLAHYRRVRDSVAALLATDGVAAPPRSPRGREGTRARRAKTANGDGPGPPRAGRPSPDEYALAKERGGR
jgi:hypothetical protein